MSKSTGKYVRLDEAEIAWLRKQVDERGDAAVAKELGMNDQTLARMMAGMRIQRMTARILRQRARDVELHGNPKPVGSLPVDV